MVIKKFLCTALLLAGLMSSAEVSAQDAIRWKGNNYETLLSNGATKVYLYNVGTGRFLIHGGDWGTQARLFYEDTGKTLTLQYGNNTGRNNIIFETGMNTGGSSVLGSNIPEITSNSYNPWDNGDNTYTVMMDGSELIGNGNTDPMLARNTYRNIHFKRVQGTASDVFTYYIYEDFGNRSTKYNKENNGSGTASSGDYSGVYMGAAYGENWRSFDGDPNGALVLLSSSFDKVTWTTVDPLSTTPWPCEVKEVEGYAEGTIVQRSMDDEVPIFNLDTEVELRKLYQWRIVTEEQLLASMTNSDVNDGLTTNLTYLINDRGFERNDWSFFDYWNTAQFSDVTYNPSGSGSGRYRYTWGMIQKNGTSSGYWNIPTTTSWETWSGSYIGSRTVSGEYYTYPVRLKAQWNSKTDAKFGFLEFEGIGTAYTYIEAPETGVYKISGYGFYQGSHEGYLFATTTNPANQGLSTTSIPSTQKKVFKNVTGQTKNTIAGVKAAGNDFVYDKDDYYAEIEVHATKGQRIYFGVGKNGATRATGSGYYYYDSDWVGADQFQIYYLGNEPAKLFDEDKTVSFSDANYMGTSSFTNRTIRLHRKFQKNKWNSFVFPLDLTAVQVRSAFGNDTRVAELKGIGVTDLSNNADIIDFASISLGAEDKAIEAGKLYLLMPTNDPTPGIASTENKDYYTLGAASFSGTTLDAVTMNQDIYKPAAGSKNADAHNNIKIDGTFFSSLDYADTSLGNKNPNKEGAYIPANSYVIGMKNGVYTIYYTQSDLKTKGFRGWIVDVEAQQAKSYKMAINGVSDETDAIENILGESAFTFDGSAIYDLSGRKVAANANQLNTLPKGMYIVNGKKYVVK